MISIVINLDTRPGFMEQESEDTKMFSGTRSYDFISPGIINKWQFLKDAGVPDNEIEVIAYIDIHEEVPKELTEKLLSDKRINVVVFRRHEERYDGSFWPKWNDANYMNALVLARGDYIMHFDGDMAAFMNDANVLKEWKQMLDSKQYDYISYNSPYSPNAVNDPDFSDYMWASTRFFFCRKDIFDYTEIMKCLRDNDYMYSKYGEKKRKCPWLEHVLGIRAGLGRVYYPPMAMDRFLIFTWGAYKRGVYEKLMNGTYPQMLEYVRQCGGVCYPIDVKAR